MTTGCLSQSLGDELVKMLIIIIIIISSMGLRESLYILLCILNFIRTLPFYYVFFSKVFITWPWHWNVWPYYFCYYTQNIHREVAFWVARWASFNGCLLLWFFFSELAFPTTVLPSQQLFLVTLPSMGLGSRQTWIWSFFLWPAVWHWANHLPSLSVLICNMGLNSCFVEFLVFSNICKILQYLVHLNCSINVSYD